jgi:cytochrome b involved in lipid metabolism
MSEEGGEAAVDVPVVDGDENAAVLDEHAAEAIPTSSCEEAVAPEDSVPIIGGGEFSVANDGEAHDAAAFTDDADAAVASVDNAALPGEADAIIDTNQDAAAFHDSAGNGSAAAVADDTSGEVLVSNDVEEDTAAVLHAKFDGSGAAAEQLEAQAIKPQTPVLIAPSEHDAPVKSRGSAQYPLAELTRSGDLPYYTPAQVARHCEAADCWLSLLGKVIDVTGLLHSESPELTQSLVSAAGTDISHWFTKDGELKTVYDVNSGLRRYQTPAELPLLHAPPPYPHSDFDLSFGDAWWRQEKLIVGLLTQKTRKLRVVNMLLSTAHVIDVCAEQKICDIKDLYRSYNAHAGSYTWKKLGSDGKMEVLDGLKTLEENGLPDMSAELAELLIDEASLLLHLFATWI